MRCDTLSPLLAQRSIAAPTGSRAGSIAAAAEKLSGLARQREGSEERPDKPSKELKKSEFVRDAELAESQASLGRHPHGKGYGSLTAPGTDSHLQSESYDELMADFQEHDAAGSEAQLLGATGAVTSEPAAPEPDDPHGITFQELQTAAKEGSHEVDHLALIGQLSKPLARPPAGSHSASRGASSVAHSDPEAHYAALCERLQGLNEQVEEVGKRVAERLGKEGSSLTEEEDYLFREVEKLEKLRDSVRASNEAKRQFNTDG